MIRAKSYKHVYKHVNILIFLKCINNQVLGKLPAVLGHIVKRNDMDATQALDWLIFDFTSKYIRRDDRKGRISGQ